MKVLNLAERIVQLEGDEDVYSEIEFNLMTKQLGRNAIKLSIYRFAFWWGVGIDIALVIIVYILNRP